MSNYTGTIDTTEMTHAAKTAQEAAVAKADAEAVQMAISKLEPKVDAIDRFPWSSGYQYQAVEQGLTVSHLPKHALQYLRYETGWEAETFKPEEWTEEDAIAVGLGKKECPHCMGSGYVQRNFLGKLTRIQVTMPQACMCFFNRLFYSRWLNPANVPADYRNVRLKSLATFTKNFATFPSGGANNPGKLEDLVAKVTKYRHNCYLLVGPAGTGKTTLMIAMYHRALTGWAIQAFKTQNPTPAVWKVTATSLAKQFREWELRDIGRDADTGAPTPSPEVTPNKVLAAIRAGYVPCLFIDELDKFKMNSEFQAKEFSAVIDAIQSNGGQVFASSNIGTESLTVALGEQFGPAILRRLCGARLNPANPDNPADPEVGGFLVNFWRGTIEQNHKIPIAQEEGFLPVFAARPETAKIEACKEPKTPPGDLQASSRIITKTPKQLKSWDDYGGPTTSASTDIE